MTGIARRLLIGVVGGLVLLSVAPAGHTLSGRSTALPRTPHLPVPPTRNA